MRPWPKLALTLSWVISNTLRPRPYPTGLRYLRARARQLVVGLVIAVPVGLLSAELLERRPDHPLSRLLRRAFPPPGDPG